MLQLSRKFRKASEDKRTLEFWDERTGEWLGKIILSESNTSNEVRVNLDFIQRINIHRPDKSIQKRNFCEGNLEGY